MAPLGRVTQELLDTQLAKRPLLQLAFSPLLEAYYETATKAARVWTIRLNLAIGIVAYNIFSVVDRGAILPDLGWAPFLWRVGVVTPIALIAMWKCDTVSSEFRENYLTVMMLSAMAGPCAFILFSHAQLAPYTMLVALLVSMFGNITIRLRFQHAAFFTIVTLIFVTATLCLRLYNNPLLSLHLWLAILVCSSFGLVANNQLERTERLTFLLGMKDRLKTEELSLEKDKFSKLSEVDPLTGLANRRAFDSRLWQLWRRYKEEAELFSLLMIDVDFFKSYNDNYGHLAGDGCLATIGDCLRQVIVRDLDLIARYGGEEFAVLLAGCKETDAVEIGNQICMSLRRARISHDYRGDDDGVVTVSIGVSACNAEGVIELDSLITIADDRLYLAKRAGRNRVFSKV